MSALSDALNAAQPAPAAPPTTQPGLADRPFWDIPQGASMGDYLKAVWNKQMGFGTANQAAQDYARTAVDAASFGTGDRLQASLTGNTVEQERALTQQAKQRLGAMAPITEGAMYAMGPGELGLAGKAADLVAPAIGRWAGGVAGSAAEGAAAGAAGAAGHGEDVGTGTLYGGLGGAVGGIPGGVAGQKALPAMTKTAADFDQIAQGAYGEMGRINYHPSIVDQAYSQATPTLTKSQLADITDGFKQTVRQQRKMNGMGQATSADSIDGFARNLQDSATSNADRVLAGRISDNLNGVLDNASTTSGHPPGVASNLQDLANQAIGQRNDLSRLEDWGAKAQVAGGPDVSSQASSWLRSGEGQRIAPQGSDLYKATNTLAATPAQPGYLPYWAKHYVMAPMAGLAAGEGLAYLTGNENSVPGRVAEDIAMAAAFGGGAPAYARISGAARGAAQQRAIDALRTTIGTGRLQTPPSASSPVGSMIRNLWGGQMAGGGPGS